VPPLAEVPGERLSYGKKRFFLPPRTISAPQKHFPPVLELPHARPNAVLRDCSCNPQRKFSTPRNRNSPPPAKIPSALIRVKNPAENLFATVTESHLAKIRSGNPLIPLAPSSCRSSSFGTRLSAKLCFIASREGECTDTAEHAQGSRSPAHWHAEADASDGSKSSLQKKSRILLTAKAKPHLMAITLLELWWHPQMFCGRSNASLRSWWQTHLSMRRFSHHSPERSHVGSRFPSQHP
jgi:hypothetical protein